MTATTASPSLRHRVYQHARTLPKPCVASLIRDTKHMAYWSMSEWVDAIAGQMADWPLIYRWTREEIARECERVTDGKAVVA